MFPVRLSVWVQPASRTVGLYILSVSLPHRLKMRTEGPKYELHYAMTDVLTAKQRDSHADTDYGHSLTRSTFLINDGVFVLYLLHTCMTVALVGRL